MLQILESKIHTLLLTVKKLKEDNERLTNENCHLVSQIEAMKGNLLKDCHNMDELHKERELTKLVVDDLIRSIDSLVEKEQVK
ncbi:hypothetical protein M1446_01280 [Candidatus Dependentiae bacterium]|nr:hypothetical protein [Candidatus Dependentiae bacterium]